MLVTLIEIKDRLGIADNSSDDFLNTQNEFVSDTIEDYCGRKFNSASYTETFYADEIVSGGDIFNELFSFHYPVISVSEIRVNDEIFTDYRNSKPSGKFLRVDSGVKGQWFFCKTDKVEIDYTAGYATVPSIIKEVCLSIIEERYNKNSAGIGMNFGSDVQSVSIPGTINIQFDYTLQNNERSRRHGNVIGNYANMLDPFRSERVVIGKIVDSYI